MGGILVTLLLTAALVTVDPIQSVGRAAPVSLTSVPPAPPATAAASSAFSRTVLPSRTWAIVGDGERVAYVRVSEDDDRGEIVVKSLASDDWRAVHRAPAGAYISFLAFSGEAIAFEEVAGARVAIRALRIAGGDAITVDEFEAGPSALPATDGRRVAWVRQGRDIRLLELASGAQHVAFRATRPVVALALWRERLAFTLVGSDGDSTSYLVAGDGSAAAIPGFTSSLVRSVGSRGVLLTGVESWGRPAASWLVGQDGTRTRLASDCANVALSGRVLALRCGERIEVRDLATGGLMIQRAPDAGSLVALEDGAAWIEGDDLVRYRFDALSPPGSPASPRGPA